MKFLKKDKLNNMTNEEKQFIKKVFMDVNFYSYKGKFNLFEKQLEIATRYKMDSVNSEKNKMKFINEFFPIFKEVWKTEKEYIIDYLNTWCEISRNQSGNKLEKIMNKYYNI